ncbi:hypothetical protein B9Z55_016798 [Caenorhabditis nigoni]|uniref:Uncharacterized protein n=1 Tax=Caenorhabditis nigoni TaxID=1611254 RepID=A0A2G5T696_9PELO|nr:hypothetical protein B9Z55_016798 [Caenorhabditis nigoni]
MVAELLITTDMINSFKSCIAQKNYKHFFDKYKRTLCRDLDNLTSVLLENETSIVIAQTIRNLVRFLENFNPKYPGSNLRGVIELGSVSKKIQEDMKDAILKMNWDSFYNEYVPYIDYIIDKAREQRIIFVRVEHGNNWYPNFSSRGNEEHVFPKTDTNLEKGYPFKTKNSGELLKVRPVRSHNFKTFQADVNGSRPTNSKVGDGANNCSNFFKRLLTANHSLIMSPGNMGNREETEVGTIDARTDQALNNLRPPTPDEQNSMSELHFFWRT